MRLAAIVSPAVTDRQSDFWCPAGRRLACGAAEVLPGKDPALGAVLPGHLGDSSQWQSQGQQELRGVP